MSVFICKLCFEAYKIYSFIHGCWPCIKIFRRIPYKFSYEFKDEKGKVSKMMIEDWEMGALYWSCLESAKGDEDIATKKVKQKYLDDFAKTKDLYLFLGTTRQYHFVAPNPFIIIGTFHPKLVTQIPLF